MILELLFIVSALFLSLSAIVFKERVIKADILASILNIASFISILIVNGI